MEENETVKNSVDVTESVVNETVEQTEEEFDDFNDDTDEVESTEEKTQKKKMSREESKIQAQKRREREAKENYKKGVIDATQGINPYTKEKMEDDFDLEIYKTMVEMDKKGLDPLTDYHKYVADKKREEAKELAKQQEAKIKQQAEIDNDISVFKSKYPNVDLKKMLETDEVFKMLSETLLGTKPATEIYEQKLRLDEIINKRIEDKLIDIEAKRMGSPGSLGDTNEIHEGDYNSMSKKEFQSVLDKALSGALKRN